MASENHPLGITSPLFLYGAYQQEPELRAASVRGQLRYWFRAIEGAKDANLETLRERERNVFGSTERGSQVSIRLYEMNRLETVETSMLPHRSNGKSLAKAFKQGQTFDLQVVTRPGVKIPNAFQRALYTWFLLGGLGKRSRRMFGAFNVNNRDNVNNREIVDFSSADKLIASMEYYLQSFIKNSPSQSVPPPPFPTLHPQHSWVIVGKTTEYREWQPLMIDLFQKLLRTEKYRNAERNFGYAMQGRRASPLIAQMRKVGKHYIPILTVMRSEVQRSPIDWKVLNNFMRDATELWDGETVWGGELK